MSAMRGGRNQSPASLLLVLALGLFAVPWSACLKPLNLQCSPCESDAQCSAPLACDPVSKRCMNPQASANQCVGVLEVGQEGQGEPLNAERPEQLAQDIEVVEPAGDGVPSMDASPEQSLPEPFGEATSAGELSPEGPSLERSGDAGEPVVPEHSVPLTFIFSPASGSLVDVKDLCIKVTPSGPVRRWREYFLEDAGKTHKVPLSLSVAKGTGEATLCAPVLLVQNTDYRLHLEVSDSMQTWTGQAQYKTKRPYAQGPSIALGSTVGLKLSKIYYPELINSLLQGQNVGPLLVHFHQKAQGSAGVMTALLALGKTPLNTTPHQGKDVVDNTNNPGTSVLQGKFDGRWFSLRTPQAAVLLSNTPLLMKDFVLSGLFDSSASNLEAARFLGKLDIDEIKRRFSMDLCAIVVCSTDASGKKFVWMSGELQSTRNPIGFALFIGAPGGSSLNAPLQPKFSLFFTQSVQPNQVSVSFSTCTGSRNANAPCRTTDGASVTQVTNAGSLQLATGGKAGEYTAATLQAATWYKMVVKATLSGGVSFETFVVFQTQ